LNIEELADEIIRMEYPTYEQTTIPQMKNSIIRKKQQIKFILEQRIKSACKFYLRYKDKPELLKDAFPKLTKEIEQKDLESIYTADGNYHEYQRKKYNEWLFKLAFKDVMKNDINR